MSTDQKNGKLLYKCRRCNQVFQNGFSTFNSYGFVLDFVTGQNIIPPLNTHKCEDQKGIGLADFAGVEYN